MPPTEDRSDPALAGRMFAALNALERAEGRRVTLRELGARIARAMGRHERPYDAGVVRRWINGRAPDSRELWIAIASVLDCEPGWLAFGTPEQQEAAALQAMKEAQRHPLPAPHEPEPEMPAGFEDYAGEDVTPRAEPPRKAANDRGKGRRR